MRVGGRGREGSEVKKEGVRGRERVEGGRSECE